MTVLQTHLSPSHSARRRRVLQLAGGGLLASLAPALVRAQAPAWQQIDAIRHSIGDAPVLQQGLQLTLPLVAEDGSSVPLAVSSGPAAQAARITRLHIFAPNNPTPEVAAFEFGPEVENVNLATRIRLSESQTVVVVAHTADGKAYVEERPVRVTTSGCVAPAQSDPANEMRARVRLPKSWKAGTPAEVLTMISHPMITGLAQDTDGNTPPIRIIDRFQATLDGRPVVSATFFRSLAANPYLKFDVNPKQAGEMHFQWTENTGRTAEHAENLRAA